MDQKLIAAMGTCAKHAQDLLEAAKAVQQIGRHNIA
jgi:hypothetical protein